MEKIFAGTYSGGIFLSTNNGNNWTQVNDELIDFDIRALTVSETNILLEHIVMEFGGDLYQKRSLMFKKLI